MTDYVPGKTMTLQTDEYSQFSYDEKTRELKIEDHHQCWLLSRQSGKLLTLFLHAPEHTLTRDEIRFQLWGHDIVSDDVINHAISRLRKHLNHLDMIEPITIQTIPSVGYRLVGLHELHDPNKVRRWVVLLSIFSMV